MIKAELAVSKSLMRAYSELPKKIQRKFREFSEKFRNDPTGSGINFERIEGAQDDKVRSVRIDQAYRAIVIHPPKGDVFLCVWVDHHDEAYAWVRNKRFGVNAFSGAMQVYDLEAVEAATPPAPESRSPGLLDDVTDEDLLLGGVPEPLLPSLRSLKTDDDLDALRPYLPEDAAEVVVGLAAGFTLTEVLEEVDRARSAEPVDPEDYAEALQRPVSQQQFRVVADDDDLHAMLDAPLQQWRVFLHPSQRQLVTRHANGPMRVLGGAGTGKTVVLMHRARHLVREVFPGADDRILVTTFTRNLAADLEANLRTLCGRDAARIEVTSLHSWAAGLLRRQGMQLQIVEERRARDLMQQAVDELGDQGLPAGFFVDEWRQVVQPQDVADEAGYVRARRVGRGTRLSRPQRLAVWQVLARYRELLDERREVEWADVVRLARLRIDAGSLDQRYRAVLADEVQDFGAPELRLLRALVPPGEHDLFLVGDGHQRIYGRPVALGACGIEIRGRSRRLKINYRTTEPIRDFAVAVLEGQAVDDLDGGADSLRGYTSLRGGVRPEIRHFAREAGEAEHVVATVRRWLASVPASAVCVAARTRGAVTDRYLPLLEQAGIRSVEIRIEGEDRLPDDAVRVATMHRLKGLEFPCILLAGVQRGEVPYELRDAPDEAAREDHELQERCLFYVAASRARDELVVCGFGEPSPLLGGHS